jgi:CubicO group peptidase (beta-lactamase class C family)
MKPPIERRVDDALSAFAEAAGRDGIRKVVVSRDRHVLWSGPDADRPQGVWSITKTICSLTLGLLLDDGRISFDQKAATILPELEAAFPYATIRQFASMTSGYFASGDETPINGYAHGPSRTPFTPSDRPQFAPGTAYSYWDSAPNMLALALTRIAGEPLAELFRRRIAAPLAMPLHWGAWLHGDLPVNGGSGNHFGQAQSTARGLLHLGEMMMDRGVWQGRRLVSEHYSSEALKPAIGADVPLFTDQFDGRNRYGLFWWLNGRNAAGELKWPGVEEPAFSASGYNNNDLFVLPNERLVVVRLGVDQDHDGAISDAQYAALLRDIVSAVSP